MAGSTGTPRGCMVCLGERNTVLEAEVQGARQVVLLGVHRVALLEVRRGVLREIRDVLGAVLVPGIHRRGCLAGFSHQGVRKASDEGHCHRRPGLGLGLLLPSAVVEGELRSPGGIHTVVGSCT